MISGIPYFGEETQELTEKILNKDIEYIEYYESLYELINKNLHNKIVVIINNKWLSWLNDIAFNYKEHECCIPYYTYELFELNDKKYKSNNKGHLILKDNTLYIRYNYTYKKMSVKVGKESINLYNIDTDKKYSVYINKWIDDNYFEIDKLYRLYLESCFVEDDFTYNKHSGGYHYIYKSPKEFKNRERKIRDTYDLPTYTLDNSFEKEYRDVRNFKYEEVIQSTGFIETTELYKIRRLKFESYLYCLLRQNLKPLETDESKNKQFINQWNKLGITKDHIKYGENNIKLIIKAYWLNNYNQTKMKSWSRV